MVYDCTDDSALVIRTGEPGYAVFTNPDSDGQGKTYDIFQDDGTGNGDFICGVTDLYWARRIAHSLDLHAHSEFDHNGNLK